MIQSYPSHTLRLFTSRCLVVLIGTIGRSQAIELRNWKDTLPAGGVTMVGANICKTHPREREREMSLTSMVSRYFIVTTITTPTEYIDPTHYGIPETRRHTSVTTSLLTSNIERIRPFLLREPYWGVCSALTGGNRTIRIR